jgi:ribosomal protein S3
MIDKTLMTVIKKWKNEAGVNEPIRFKYTFALENKTLITIYCSRPGLMIGYKGQLIDKYRKFIQSNFICHELEIRFEEVDRLWA